MSEVESKIKCDYVFSDILYRPFFCTYIPPKTYASNIPDANVIARLKNLSTTDYSNTWGCKPFILTHHAQEWSLFESWDFEYLLKLYQHVKFQAEGVNWRLTDYIDYMRNNCDESPLYLFDKDFYDKMKLGMNHLNHPSYTIPECFKQDLFMVLGDQRPDFRWLIIGPERSGSTYHKDPNATSAWNAVIRGSKYWIMFPTTISRPSPPGVFVSEDESEVTSPLSIAEWLLCFHAEARRTPGCIEGICKAGEILHVPSGWWHLVVNLEPTIAITQNFVPHFRLPEVLHFLEHKASQVSGFKRDIVSPFHTFTEKMQEMYPDLMQKVLNDLPTNHFKRRKLASTVNQKEAKGFTFGFYDAEIDEDA